MLVSLATDRARVADLDAEILVLERSLSALRSQRARVQERLEAYKYPVLTLPNEIIAEIFTHYWTPIHPLFPRFTGLYSPTLLTQICHKWRGIALETPRLWRAISLPDANIPLEKQSGLTDAWLSRSRGCPISLQFDPALVEGELGTEIPTAIVPYRARLEQLVINRASLPQLRTFDGPMPILRHLELLLYDLNLLATKISFCEAPLLRTVLLNADAVQNTIMPWAQLTSLALHGLFPRECAPILQQTSNLVHCELALVEDLRDEDIPDVTLLTLESLTLTHIVEDHSVTGYLQTLTVPVLHSLRVPESFLGPNSIDTLKSFVSKSGCNLQELCITGTSSGFDSPYHAAFPSMKVSFADYAMSSAQWLMSKFRRRR
ncbi:F-box domain-containing protein [Mycena sanguinolenta]|uniref:F-box domain-containing protein n=1 Tax=Mycena sanguinolenta TaxID=230812 RepID=A0A8H7DDH8_9AGAR|nr:F-box domain-containing protein [Mycena sanguinolenta]